MELELTVAHVRDILVSNILFDKVHWVKNMTFESVEHATEVINELKIMLKNKTTDIETANIKGGKIDSKEYIKALNHFNNQQAQINFILNSEPGTIFKKGRTAEGVLWSGLKFSEGVVIHG